MQDAHYIPSWQDKPAKFLFWPADVPVVTLIVAAVSSLVLKTLFDSFAIAGYAGFVCGLVAGYYYNKFKAGKHVGAVRHALYWHLGAPSLKGLPPSHVRTLMG
jgi:type IV conjugative transfer system protein TraL